MPRYDIEQWEQEQAEVEIRRWLAARGLWAPDVMVKRLRESEERERAGGAAEPARPLHPVAVAKDKSVG